MRDPVFQNKVGGTQETIDRLIYDLNIHMHTYTYTYTKACLYTYTWKNLERSISWSDELAISRYLSIG